MLPGAVGRQRCFGYDLPRGESGRSVVSIVVAVRKEGRTVMAADTQSNCGGIVELWEAT